MERQHQATRRITLNWTDNSVKETGFTVQRATRWQFHDGTDHIQRRREPLSGGNTVTYTDTTAAEELDTGTGCSQTALWSATLGLRRISGFPTMSADSVSNTAGPIHVGTAPAGPAAPTNLTATLQAGPQVSLTWRDNATNETGFVVERCTGSGAAATSPRSPWRRPRNNTGNVTYVDTTVTAGNSYLYRVAAVNSASVLSVHLRHPCDGRGCARDSGGSDQFYGIGRQGQRQQLHGYADLGRTTLPTRPTSPSSAPPTLRSRPACPASRLQQHGRGDSHADRVAATQPTTTGSGRTITVGGSSAWTNALPFPIRTGP